MHPIPKHPIPKPYALSVTVVPSPANDGDLRLLQRPLLSISWVTFRMSPGFRGLRIMGGGSLDGPEHNPPLIFANFERPSSRGRLIEWTRHNHREQRRRAGIGSLQSQVMIEQLRSLRRQGKEAHLWPVNRLTHPSRCEAGRGYALTESVGAGVAVLESLVAAGAAAAGAAAAGAGAAGAGAAPARCSPPWPLGAATATDEVVEMPRSLSTSLAVRPVALAIADALSPCWAICWIWAPWERCTVSSAS